MRNFVAYLNQDLEGYKKKDCREARFWKDIAGDGILSESEPPLDYPTPIDVNAKGDFLLR